MARLIALSPGDGLLPVEIGGVTLDEAPLEAVTWVAPYRNRTEAVAKALGFAWPGPNETRVHGETRAVWIAPRQALILGPAVAPEGAAVADQSDGWACLTLTGEVARAVLARLTPVDLREGAFPVDAAARTLMGHLTVSLIRTGAAEWQILVFRSMVRTAVHDIERAMKGVAARAGL